jgi:hypothetical protein
MGVLPLTSPHIPWATFHDPRFIPPWPLLSFDSGSLVAPFLSAVFALNVLSFKCLPFIFAPQELR